MTLSGLFLDGCRYCLFSLSDLRKTWKQSDILHKSSKILAKIAWEMNSFRFPDHFLLVN